MSLSNHPLHRSGRGFSLVEIMIAVVVGMLGILIIMQVFLVAEGQKRTTTGGADAQENALMTMFTLEREFRIAGLGLVVGPPPVGVGMDCTTVNSYNGAAAYSFSPWPVTIARDTPAAGSDRITVVYSTSAFGNIPTTLKAQAPNSNIAFTVANGDGFEVGNLVIVSEPGMDCTVAQISATKVASGSYWDLAHTGLTYNPGGNNFPPSGYNADTSRLTNMGSMVNHEYYVANNNLMMRDVNLPNSATNPIALVSGVVSIRAQYGRDTTVPPDGWVDVWDNTNPASATDVVAVRFAVVARSGQLENTAVSPATLVLWNGGTTANGGAITLDATARTYRYKTYQTTIPLRNVIWNSN
ncbi:MAG: PilW family protein [Sulfuricaulis sp.]|nr:PilW family protein [Sulfuricaulis sp.]